MSSVKEAISKLVSGTDLSEEEASLAMSEIVDGVASPSQIGSFLTALRIKGETVEEVATLARTLRERAFRISPIVPSSPKLTDTAGTGGDKVKTLNISTIAALVISGAGVPVAKHGNRSFTSKCGSADLFERFGVDVNANPATVKTSIEQAGIGFIFAPVFHPAMKHASATRKEIGIRTVFNILGPLTNPAGARAQIVGTYDDSLVLKMSKVLQRLGVEEAIVAHGLDGMDEISLLGKTHVARLHANAIEESILTSSSFGLAHIEQGDLSEPDDIEGHAEMSLRILIGGSLSSQKEKALKSMILINAAAGLVVSGRADDYLDGVEIARESLDGGMALKKLELLVKYSRGDESKIESLLSGL